MSNFKVLLKHTIQVWKEQHALGVAELEAVMQVKVHDDIVDS